MKSTKEKKNSLSQRTNNWEEKKLKGWRKEEVQKEIQFIGAFLRNLINFFFWIFFILDEWKNNIISLKSVTINKISSDLYFFFKKSKALFLWYKVFILCKYRSNNPNQTRIYIYSYKRVRFVWCLIEFCYKGLCI